jgi:3-hydroxymyristoyl/3-hydroxydecanoyl-(acyl carrier protein) dehydratase
MNKLTLCIAADHPAGVGHFPGNPIIPGALLLAEALRSIGDNMGVRLVSCNVKSAKFQHPVRPGDRVEIEYSYSAQGVIDFRCAVAGTRVLSGAISATVDA